MPTELIIRYTINLNSPKHKYIVTEIKLHGFIKSYLK